VLHHTATSANAVVVPTLAMADRLARFVDVPTERLVHIPWGVPDELLATIGERSPAPGDRLRILYAGRLTSEKAAVSILRVVAGPDGVELSVAAPPAEYARLSETSNLSEVRYLGWFTRPQLWREFARHDLLIVPSLALEAFGLVAVEAQACGLPVAFHGVPGLTEVMADSGFCVNFHDTAEVIALLRRLRESPALLDEAREAGWANSRRFPLSATAAGLNELSAALTTSRSLS
jgi:glycosyltransferase involved in cell wall biosynthesis